MVDSVSERVSEAHLDGSTGITSRLGAIYSYNRRTFRQRPLAEMSGCLGDLGTLLPLMMAMSIQGSIALDSTLVFSGLANILTGTFYGMPIAVQPMKAIASAAISQKFTPDQTAASGLVVAIAVLLLSTTGLLYWLNRFIPVPIVKGIQVGAGLNLVISAGSSLEPLSWADSSLDNRLWAIVAFVFLLIATVQPRIPYALIVFVIGLVFAVVMFPGSGVDEQALSFWAPSLSFPSGEDWIFGAVNGALPQLPLTLLNSIIAVSSLSASLFPDYPSTPSTTSIGLSVAMANLIGCWSHAMPICHGSGGLAAQYRFGARSGSSIILLGVVKLLLGLCVGQAMIPILKSFPTSLLVIMVLAAGVELAKVGREVGGLADIWNRTEAEAHGGRSISVEKRQELEREGQDRWMVMLITTAGCIGFKNDAVGFLAGIIWHLGLKSPSLYRDWRSHGRGHIRLEDDTGEGHA